MQMLLIVITGRPGTGKTTLAHRLSLDLGTPAFCKDEYKEKLFDTLGWSDKEWSQKLGLAAWRMMDHAIVQHLACSSNLIVEGNFLREYDSERIAGFVQKHQARVVQIVLQTEESVRAERYSRRNAENRHPGHHARDVLHEHLSEEKYPPLDLPGTLLEIDTTDFSTVDYPGLLRTVVGHSSQNSYICNELAENS